MLTSIHRRITLQCGIDIDTSQVPWSFGPVCFDRSPDGFCVYSLHEDADGSTGDGANTCECDYGPLATRPTLSRKIDAADAWEYFQAMLDSNDGSIFIGPGDTAIAFDDLVVEADRFTVFDVTSGRPVLVSKFWTRIEAMQAAKAIVLAGGCPLVVSHHLQPDREWETITVVESQELIKRSQS